jgi:hypothetical protein
MCAYPVIKARTDMGFQEYMNYKTDWTYFNTVWSYNYTVSTMNGLEMTPMHTPYSFQTYGQMLSYSNGQVAHIAAYPTATQFSNIY